MPAYAGFEDLPVWQEAARLYLASAEFLKRYGHHFSPGFRSQLDRAALSVSNNIAEGFERVACPDLLNFLGIARGSAGEVRSMLAVAGRFKNLQANLGELQEVRGFAESCSRQLTGWILNLEGSEIKGKRYRTAKEQISLKER